MSARQPEMPPDKLTHGQTCAQHIYYIQPDHSRALTHMANKILFKNWSQAMVNLCPDTDTIKDGGIQIVYTKYPQHFVNV